MNKITDGKIAKPRVAFEFDCSKNLDQLAKAFVYENNYQMVIDYFDPISEKFHITLIEQGEYTDEG